MFYSFCLCGMLRKLVRCYPAWHSRCRYTIVIILSTKTNRIHTHLLLNKLIWNGRTIAGALKKKYAEKKIMLKKQNYEKKNLNFPSLFLSSDVTWRDVYSTRCTVIKAQPITVVGLLYVCD